MIAEFVRIFSRQTSSTEIVARRSCSRAQPICGEANGARRFPKRSARLFHQSKQRANRRRRCLLTKNSSFFRLAGKNWSAENQVRTIYSIEFSRAKSRFSGKSNAAANAFGTVKPAFFRANSAVRFNQRQTKCPSSTDRAAHTATLSTPARCGRNSRLKANQYP